MENNESKIAIGTWSWGVGGFAGGNIVFGNNLNSPELTSVFNKAINSGLNVFDTAFAYANGESERILGELINKYDRNQIIISDKFTPGMENNEVSNPLMEMLEGSLERLGTDYIDIYWIHNAADIEKWTPLLIDAVNSGKVKRVGVSNHSLEQLKRVEEILLPAKIKVTAVQNHFSLLYRKSLEDGLLEYCKEKNIDFFSYMVLEQGALSGKYDENHLLPAASNRGKKYNSIFPQIEELLSKLKDIGSKNNRATAAQVAAAWAIWKGTIPILGITKEEQVEEASKIFNLKITEKDYLELETLATNSNVDTFGGWEGNS